MALDNKFIVKFMQLEIGPLQVRENVVGFEKALGAVKMIKDQIHYRSQSLLNLARGHFTNKIKSMSDCISLGAKLWKQLRIDFCPISLWESCHCIRYKLYQISSQKTHVEHAKSW